MLSTVVRVIADGPGIRQSQVENKEKPSQEAVYKLTKYHLEILSDWTKGTF